MAFYTLIRKTVEDNKDKQGGGKERQPGGSGGVKIKNLAVTKFKNLLDINLEEAGVNLTKPTGPMVEVPDQD